MTKLEDGLRIRRAVPEDIDALIRLEEACFQEDRISRRSFRTLLARPTATTIIATFDDRLVGYAMLLFRKGTALVRLYSLAVSPDYANRGLGRHLLKAAEQTAFDKGRVYLRLEVREDNEKAITLYRRCGYRPIGRYLNYYEDHAPALRFEKTLRGDVPVETTVPYYQQVTDFTCGPACIMMALKYFKPETKLNSMLELRIWRGATTVYMLSGPGGCEPYGLAVRAHEYGLRATIFVSTKDYLFLGSVRDARKREIMEIAQADFRQQAKDANIPVHHRAFSINDIKKALAGGAVALVLISSYLMFDEKIPHWVLAHSDDGKHIMIHDPWVEEEEGETIADSANLPLTYELFDHMARFGKDGLRACVILEA